MPAGQRPCLCERFLRGQPFRVERDCPLCYLYHHDPRYRRLWGEGRPARPPTRRKGRDPLGCVHLGEPTGEQVECSSCRGKVVLKVLACALHGTCLPSRAVAGLPCCVLCADYQDNTSAGGPSSPASPADRAS
jgi:hypothetical protein